eukprot:scaffold6331_cov195-Cylindrotheca_fusiformis.AAC.11
MGCTSSKGTTVAATTTTSTTTTKQTTTDDNQSATISSNTLALGAGCYWGTEKYIVKNFQKKFPNSIRDAKVGFMNPNPSASKQKKKQPTYRQVCTGRTGHVEVLNLVLNDPVTTELFTELIRFFFSFHDPTTLNQQGNDRGSQYASVIFCSDPTQMEIANQVKAELQQFVTQRKITAFAKSTVTTAVVEYTEFFPAQAEHQQYLSKHPFGYCNHRIRFQKWPRVQ